MAVRLTLRDETGTPVAVVSADDADELLLVSTLALLVPGAPAFTAERHGDGVFDPADVRELARVTREVTVGTALSLAESADRAAQVVRWLAALHQALDHALRQALDRALDQALPARADTGTGLAWEVAYDRGGSIDDGEDEYVTDARVCPS